MCHLENRGAGETERGRKVSEPRGQHVPKLGGEHGHHGAGRSLFHPEHKVSRHETPRSQPAQNPHTRLSVTLTLEAKGQQGHDKPDLGLKRQSRQVGGCVTEGDPEVRKLGSEMTPSIQLRFS